MELFNKSKRTFTISTGTLKPEQSISVPDAEGSKLISMYDGELIQVGNSKAEQENAELKKEIANLKQNKKHFWKNGNLRYK